MHPSQLRVYGSSYLSIALILKSPVVTHAIDRRLHGYYATMNTERFDIGSATLKGVSFTRLYRGFTTASRRHHDGFMTAALWLH